MPRKPQFGSIYRRGSLYWIKYYKNGEPVYESSESCKYGDAQRLLEQRRAEIYSGTHLDSREKRSPWGICWMAWSAITKSTAKTTTGSNESYGNTCGRISVRCALQR